MMTLKEMRKLTDTQVKALRDKSWKKTMSSKSTEKESAASLYDYIGAKKVLRDRGRRW